MDVLLTIQCFTSYLAHIKPGYTPYGNGAPNQHLICEFSFLFISDIIRNVFNIVSIKTIISFHFGVTQCKVLFIIYNYHAVIRVTLVPFLDYSSISRFWLVGWLYILRLSLVF